QRHAARRARARRPRHSPAGARGGRLGLSRTARLAGAAPTPRGPAHAARRRGAGSARGGAGRRRRAPAGRSRDRAAAARRHERPPVARALCGRRARRAPWSRRRARLGGRAPRRALDRGRLAPAARGVPAATGARSVSFSSPGLLAFLVAVPVAVAGVVFLERRRRARASSSRQPNMVAAPPAIRRHLPTALLLVGLALLLVGFARPKASFHVRSQEATLVFVLDVSGSMAANDAPPSRLAAAKAVVGRFLDSAPSGYRVALVTFSDHVAVAAAPTHDLAFVRSAVARAHTAEQGTALADAVARAVQLAASVRGTSSSVRPPAGIVVLSDGGQTAGRLTPQQAALRARRARVPVSTVLLGTP